MREWLARAAVAAALISTPAFPDEVKIDDLIVANTSRPRSGTQR
jgi:hypothetical protein